MHEGGVGQLYRAHQGWLQGWLHRRLACREQAADLVQDTFVRVIRSDDPPAALREPRAYLTTIARNLLSNHFRRRALETAWLDTLQALPEDAQPCEETRCLMLETLHQLDALFDAMPRRIRRTFLLSQLEGRTYTEIATTLGVNVRTVKRDMACAFSHCLLAEAA